MPERTGTPVRARAGAVVREEGTGVCQGAAGVVGGGGLRGARRPGRRSRQKPSHARPRLLEAPSNGEGVGTGKARSAPAG